MEIDDGPLAVSRAGQSVKLLQGRVLELFDRIDGVGFLEVSGEHSGNSLTRNCLKHTGQFAAGPGAGRLMVYLFKMVNK